MSDLFWLILAFPLVWPWIAKYVFHTEFTWAEMAINVGVVLLAVTVVWNTGKLAQTYDVEIWSGEVTRKASERVSCEHSYDCNCRKVCTGSGDKRTCNTECDTCYEHNYDIDWVVYTNIEPIKIKRINRQGTWEPPRWTEVQPGDSVAVEKSYTNYVRAVADSLFHEDQKFAEQYKDQIPAYPRVYDYYKIDRVQSVGVDIPNIAEWNEKLSALQKKLGPEKQANVQIIFTDVASPDYMNGLKSAWQGFKKNDIVIAVGASNFPAIDWVSVASWSKQDIVNVSLRDNLTTLGTVNVDEFLSIVNDDVVTHYQRREMREFEYLKDDIAPPTWAIVLVMLLAFVGSPLMTWYFNKPGVDIRFPFERRRNSRNGR